MDFMKIIYLDRKLCETLFLLAFFIVILWFWQFFHKQQISSKIQNREIRMTEIILSAWKSAISISKSTNTLVFLPIFIVRGRSELLVAKQWKSIISEVRVSTKPMDFMKIIHLDRKLAETLFLLAFFIVIFLFWPFVHKQHIS